jgi:hypothetical protein
LGKRDLSEGRHEFASGFIQTPFAAFPFPHQALLLAAVKFAKGRVFRDLLDNLLTEPPPGPTKPSVARIHLEHKVQEGKHKSRKTEYNKLRYL